MEGSTTSQNGLQGTRPWPALTRPVPLALQASQELLNPLHFVLSSAASIPVLSFLWTRPQKTPPQEVPSGAGVTPGAEPPGQPGS